MRQPTRSETAPDPDQVGAYFYDLPAELVAQEPAPRRDLARLLRLDLAGGPLCHGFVRELPDLLRRGDLLVVNDTRVVAASVELVRRTGGRVRGLLLEPPAAGRVRVLLRSRGRLEEGERLAVPGGGEVVVAERGEEGEFLLREGAPGSLERLASRGRMPLPPYIRRGSRDARSALDRSRYQTIFARRPGAVAAPTAGLHLTHELLGRLRARGVRIEPVTLHVGVGTFRPIRAERLSEHRMHAERYFVPERTARAVAETRRSGGRVIAVGTTVVRVLETTWTGEGLRAGPGTTSLFLRPPCSFRAVDGLLTNFHLPGSTLLVLVCAMAGRERVLAAYREAVRRRYRFYSYGDAMLLL